eukprot:365289-Chlamydomonas_euryale.AAC.9
MSWVPWAREIRGGISGLALFGIEYASSFKPPHPSSQQKACAEAQSFGELNEVQHRYSETVMHPIPSAPT